MRRGRHCVGGLLKVKGAVAGRAGVTQKFVGSVALGMSIYSLFSFEDKSHLIDSTERAFRPYVRFIQRKGKFISRAFFELFVLFPSFC